MFCLNIFFSIKLENWRIIFWLGTQEHIFIFFIYFILYLFIYFLKNLIDWQTMRIEFSFQRYFNWGIFKIFFCNYIVLMLYILIAIDAIYACVEHENWYGLDWIWNCYWSKHTCTHRLNHWSKYKIVEKWKQNSNFCCCFWIFCWPVGLTLLFAICRDI
jgi:hypothetical protein